MLPKQYRLPGYLIPRTLNSKLTYHSPLFTLKLVNLNNNQLSRLGFIVSTKISKKAVERNKIKRQLRAASYQHLKAIAPGYNLLIIAKHSLKSSSFEQIKTALHYLFKQAKIITNEKFSP